MIAQEFLLLVGRQVDHAEAQIAVNGREDLSFHAKVGVAHVRTLDRVVHGEGDATEIISAHACIARG
jgi:hypothetical protein